MTLDEKLSRIDLLLLDVDGVLTQGEVTYTDSGEQIKRFSSRDGLGLRLLMDAGIKVGIVSGRSSRALSHRCENLGISLVFDGIKNKKEALDQIIRKTGIESDRIAFVGDDLIDLPIMTRVGVSICVADGAGDVRSRSDMVTDHRGGKGAVREVCERILKARGLWDDILGKFLS